MCCCISAQEKRKRAANCRVSPLPVPIYEPCPMSNSPAHLTTNNRARRGVDHMDGGRIRKGGGTTQEQPPVIHGTKTNQATLVLHGTAMPKPPGMSQMPDLVGTTMRPQRPAGMRNQSKTTVLSDEKSAGAKSQTSSKPHQSSERSE